MELPDRDKAAAAARLNLVHVREEAQSEGGERLEWFLLTTLAVQSRQDAERVLEWYRLRWRIEDWHRVLKTGCKVEYMAHRTGERIERAVTIKAVIAWRLMAMTLLGRDTPELPAETLFSDIEIAVLEDFAKDRKLPPPDNIGRAVLTTTMLGGIWASSASAARARPPSAVGRLHPAGYHRASLRTESPSRPRQQTPSEAA